jgi:16S rRNA (guanine527-N7)-methyltransferase
MVAVEEILTEARHWGFLGPGPVEDHLIHASGFAAVFTGAGQPPPARVVDLGSGGGLPGLVLALLWPATTFVLLDANERRTAFLEDAIDRLGLGRQVQVVRARAEVYGRQERGSAAAVVARGFGPPPVTAECAAPLLAIEGRLVVSEPPTDDPERWPTAGLALLGLGRATGIVAAGARFVELRQERHCPAQYPRRVGVPNKRPLW